MDILQIGGTKIHGRLFQGRVLPLFRETNQVLFRCFQSSGSIVYSRHGNSSFKS